MFLVRCEGVIAGKKEKKTNCWYSFLKFLVTDKVEFLVIGIPDPDPDPYSKKYGSGSGFFKPDPDPDPYSKNTDPDPVIGIFDVEKTKRG